MDIATQFKIINAKLDQMEEHFVRILSFEEKLEKIVNITEFLCGHRPGNVVWEKASLTEEKKFKSNRGSETGNQQIYEKYRQCVPDFHVKVLQKNHKVLVNELCIRGPVIDDLIENEAIYHSDQETIMSCGSQKDQIRSLLMCLSRYGEENFLKFVKALNTERPDLAKNLHGDFERQKSEHSKENITCIKCCIYNQVDIKDVVDDLYSNGLVDESFVERTVATTVRRARRQLWNEVFLRMRSETDDNRSKYESLKNDILKKYGSVFSHFPDFDINENTMKCLCKAKSSAESTSSSQESDLEKIPPSGKLQKSAKLEKTPPRTTVTQVRWRPKLRKKRNVRPRSKAANLLLANVLHKWFRSFQNRQDAKQSSTDCSLGSSQEARNSQIINEDQVVLRKKLDGEDNFRKFVMTLNTERPDLAKTFHCNFERKKSEHSKENVTCIKCNEEAVKCLCEGEPCAEPMSPIQENDWEKISPSVKLQNSDKVEETPSSTTVTQVRRRPKLRKRQNVKSIGKLANLLLASALHKWFRSFRNQQSSTDFSFGLSEDARNSQIIDEALAVLRKKRIDRYKEDSGFASCEMSSIDDADEKGDEDTPVVRRIAGAKASKTSTCVH